MDTLAQHLPMNGARKVGMLMVALGAEASAEVLRHLSQDEIERISTEIANTRHVDMDVMDAVMQEFQQRLESSGFSTQGGADFAREVLEQALGQQKATEIMGRLSARSYVQPFESLRSVEPSHFARILKGEHPQTIALVVSYLPPSTGAVILSALPAEAQADVATRVATMDPASPEVIRQVEEVIQDRLRSTKGQDTSCAGGAKTLLEILNQVDRSTERTILEGLTASDPALAESIKQQMFLFEDIVKLESRAIQLVLREVDQEDLRLALKGVGDEIRDLIFSNISERAAETLKEDLELMGRVRIRDVEAAQQKIVAVIRRLEEAGEIMLGGSEEDELIE